MRRFLLLVIVFIMLSSSVMAMDLNNYDIDVTVYDKQLVVDSTIGFKKALTGNFKISLPADARGISIYLNDELITGQDWTNNIIVKLNETTDLRYNYVTSTLTDKEGFFFYRESPHNVDLFTLDLFLDPHILVKDVKNQEGTKAIYPRPKKIGSDGESIFINWEFENVEKGDLITVFAKLDYNRGFTWWPYVLVLLIILLIISVATRKKKIVYVGPRQVKKESDNPLGIDLVYDSKEESYLHHLKEDEEQVVNILKLKKGSCEQSTLVIATSFSKATLSRILKELEERNIVIKEKKGRKNVVHLKEGF